MAYIRVYWNDPEDQESVHAEIVSDGSFKETGLVRNLDLRTEGHLVLTEKDEEGFNVMDEETGEAPGADCYEAHRFLWKDLEESLKGPVRYEALKGKVRSVETEGETA